MLGMALCANHPLRSSPAFAHSSQVPHASTNRPCPISPTSLPFRSNAWAGRRCASFGNVEISSTARPCLRASSPGPGMLRARGRRTCLEKRFLPAYLFFVFFFCFFSFLFSLFLFLCCFVCA